MSPSSSQTTAAATERIADAAETAVEKTTGVKGSLGVWLQMGFGGVVAVAMMLLMNNSMSQVSELQKAGIEQVKEERALHRETLAQMKVEAAQQRLDAEVKYNRTDTAHKEAMSKMGNTIERAVTSLEKATDAMIEANRIKGGPPNP
jgi:predicted metalloprotease